MRGRGTREGSCSLGSCFDPRGGEWMGAHFKRGVSNLHGMCEWVVAHSSVVRWRRIGGPGLGVQSGSQGWERGGRKRGCKRGWPFKKERRPWHRLHGGRIGTLVATLQ
jgi:hypothetical protein